MRLATIRRPDGTTTAARLDGDELVLLPYADVVALLAEPGGRELPDHPTLFIKFPDTLTGPYDDLVVPKMSRAVDWEVELGVVIGAPARRVNEAEAAACIAGYTVVNDISMRDWQWRPTNRDQGKNF